MGFQPPKLLEDYLNQEWRQPPSNFVNFSLYYANLDPYFINYMKRVIRPALAYSSAVADNILNSGLNLNIGYAIKRTAVQIVKGDKVIFEGNDKDCKILSDKWGPSVGFLAFNESAIDYMFGGGTAAIKLNIDSRGRCIPVSIRVDRYYATTDETGEVRRIIFLNSFLFSQKYGADTEKSYWLVEERYYKRNKPYVRYKVQIKSGTANSEVLPTLSGEGININALPEEVRTLLKDKGITLNKPEVLPFRDGLGVWILRRTATNSTVPGLAMGDPLLYGVLDLLWATNVVFSGSLTDVILGKGKILVPKKYLKAIQEEYQNVVGKDAALRYSDSRFYDDSDDSLVYLYTEHDKDFTPQSIQFDIRSEQYRGMLEVYLRQIVAHCGFAPSSIFPFLADNSVKTATEVTAEENMTRATVQALHQIIEPVYNRMLNEVLYQLYKSIGEEYTDSVSIKFTDYIGNPLLRDQNIRNNYQAGLIPKEDAVCRINNLSQAETNEWVAKLDVEERTRREQESFGLKPFNDSNYYGDEDNATSGEGTV